MTWINSVHTPGLVWCCELCKKKKMNEEGVLKEAASVLKTLAPLRAERKNAHQKTMEISYASYTKFGSWLECGYKFKPCICLSSHGMFWRHVCLLHRLTRGICVCVRSRVSLGLIVLQETGYALDHVTKLQPLFQLVLICQLVISFAVSPVQNKSRHRLEQRSS